MLPWLLAAWLAAVGSDAVTTERGVARGGHELILPDARSARVAIFATQAVGGTLAIRQLWRTNHHTAAIGLALAITAAHGLAAVHNAGIE